MVATSTESPTVQFLSADGRFSPTPAAEQYASFLDGIDETQHRSFYREMAMVRQFDIDAANLQRQGQLGLWVPSHGQEAAQVGSAIALRPQDHVFPSYREHVVGKIRGIDLLGVLALLRGTTHGGWDPSDPTNGNFHLYTLVLGSQALHATGYAMGLTLDGATGTGDAEKDAAVIVYFGDGASSQGDVSEAMVFAASYQAPTVFFLQNNHYAISVPVATQSRSPLYLRSSGFGIPGVQIDGNDVLASYAVTAKHLQDARSGGGPQFIEALTYRIGAHTSSDDPTKYRTDDELASWVAKDPITRFAAFLRGNGAPQSFFDETEEEARDFAADIRRRLLALEAPPTGVMFDNVYSEPHALVEEQKAWLQRYEESFGGE
ncbi:thiamine pyrophosphate-dependent dehydrogenase E1 component subunit alpha [Rathayibacter iranicus]|uniref:2-oxoisovalerate dehydrogenase subunit alpha n=2 Tax=Rathayibacter iranicus TaxID=59737 RepID=A0AAD1ADV3_9MICO|nr:thiamine pyrophosphate-dependent dehydrogenase E1 component subunit alpha [Rathayibacter iranicus]AZZ56344.1 thiamine pyrophosphate-dependent dehydrogenase E1 component subunit alpha [Rathayibacter iranicus]MWV32171.1 pyruvate dehydrogenase (acetyl-transferring) E1 component subunit alpha [Rathayibacter iranicus NCPPB 2253 = VKM Ac-1602]PPI45547.1 pyruvate dehydrogenase (acetyl-transferring) E1 component subunit alpha [Rathayibacter iranicus]PPI59367.1 pyruvate dehydrogenase (acetyl-transfer